jgi:hypothetical protein
MGRDAASAAGRDTVVAIQPPLVGLVPLSHNLLNFGSAVQAKFSNFGLDKYAALCKILRQRMSDCKSEKTLPL